eukprot:NODE_12967_length_252_cov_1.345178.p1 GENE.NODE_12967_length_252_cov_1.345178~~NODE_12967_length_252_cov_1.345178.p1  ORF type:complete len:64 (+),score=11.59 NODE_12967_length_252_cov_1.345178:24-215(+)
MDMIRLRTWTSVVQFEKLCPRLVAASPGISALEALKLMLIGSLLPKFDIPQHILCDLYYLLDF